MSSTETVITSRCGALKFCPLQLFALKFRLLKVILFITKVMDPTEEKVPGSLTSTGMVPTKNEVKLSEAFRSNRTNDLGIRLSYQVFWQLSNSESQCLYTFILHLLGWTHKDIVLVFLNIPRNQGQTFGHLSQIIFPDLPGLSTKNIEIPWLSRRSKFSLIFPDGGNPDTTNLLDHYYIKIHNFSSSIIVKKSRCGLMSTSGAFPNREGCVLHIYQCMSVLMILRLQCNWRVFYE